MYCDHMREIRNRDALIRSIVSKEKTLGLENYDYEAIALNVRKILELIAFSSLVANKDKYAEAHEGFARHWRAKDILAELEKLHPDFYPCAANIQMQPDGSRHMTAANVDTALTREEFGELYDKCSKLLHMWNPFDPAPRMVDFRLSPLAWMNKIRDLLNTHYVRLVDDAGYWLCLMVAPEDGKPHVYTLKPVENPEAAMAKAG